MVPRSAVLAPLLLLLLAFPALQCSTVPKSAGVSVDRVERLGLQAGLVPVREAAPGVVIDLRYGTEGNLTGRPLYPRGFPALLYRGTAQKLARAQAELEAQGYGIKLWDGYRPPEAQLGLWEHSRDARYVVPPSVAWSRHCSGTAVDVTLVDRDGRELPLPTGFDHFSPAASSTYIGSSREVRRHLELLQTAMRNAGFQRIQSEWWHFDDPNASGARVVPAEVIGVTMPDHVPRVRYP